MNETVHMLLTESEARDTSLGAGHRGLVRSIPARVEKMTLLLKGV